VLDVPSAQKSFWTHLIVPQGDEAQGEAHFGLFGDSANLDANRCTICVELTKGSKVILDAPDGTPR
jgi:hypothetical protein